MSPSWFKRTAGWLYSRLPVSVRYGPELKRYVKLLRQSQWWTPQQHEAFQVRQLRELCSDAYQYTRHYREVFDRLGFRAEDIRKPSDIQVLPFLTKEIISEHRDDFIADNCRRKLMPFNTGGTTGAPLEFFWERGRTRARERAFLCRQWD